jgi:Glucose / Sorbosone dehydrogenase
MMGLPSRSTLLALFIAAAAVVSSAATARAHPPWNPYDETRFAPITRFGPAIGIEVVATGQNDAEGNPVPGTPLLASPLKAVAAPGLPNHLFIVDQVGKLWVVNLTTGVRALYLDVVSLLVPLGVCGQDTFDERGLLGVAFHPNFAGTQSGPGRGLFYTYTSEPRTGVATLPTPGTTSANADHQNVISEWQASNPGNPTSPGVGSRRELMRVNWPQFNHDGGDMAFGPDGKLYISMGDGGGADDADGQPFITAPPHYPQCGEAAIFGHQGNGNGQKLNTPLGKVLRIDVNPPFTTGKQYRVPGDNPFVGRNDPATGDPAVAEIWAFGFRNPYRFSFDTHSGNLFVGDVGQNDIEEVDVVHRGGNYGWNCKEGTLFFHINGSVPDDGTASRDRDPTRRDCNPPPIPFRDPIAQHDTHHEGHSVIGGYVYHGRALPKLRGQYVFGDFSLLFKFPTGPHDYGRLLMFDPDDKHDNHGKHGRNGNGLRSISELIVLPGGAVALSVLGIGQDAHGELYVTGNVFGVPFGNAGKVLRIVPSPGSDKNDDD